jgi:plastocyanin
MRTITDSFKVKFSEVGVYTYKCSMHTRMLGKIEVVEGAKELNVHSIKSMQ